MRFLVRVAWRNLWRHGRRSAITAGAMAMGVALCMFMLTYSDGIFAQMFDVLVSQKLGHVQVHHPDYPKKRILHDAIPDGEALLVQLEGLPHVRAATGRLNSFGLLASKETSVGGQLLGVVPAREDAVSGLAEDVFAGEYRLGENRALVGKGLAEKLKIGVGDELVVIVQAADGSMGNELLTVSGLYKTGSTSLDRSGAVVDLADLQRLVAMEGRLHEVLLLADDALLSDAIAADAKALPAAAPLLVRTWAESDPETAQMMAMQDTGAFIMLFFVFALASFGVLNTMLMSVFERTRELGVLRAVGLTPGQLMVMVILESCFLGGLAVVAGGVLGGILDWMAVVYGIDMSMGNADVKGFEWEGVTFDPVVKGVVRPQGIVFTLVTVFVVSLLASLWPAWRAARLRPVDAMREV